MAVGGKSGAMSIPATSIHPLDRPIWSALTSRQQSLAEGAGRARRYPPSIAPFADLADMSAESFAALAALVSGSELAVLFTREPVTAPADFKFADALGKVQLRAHLSLYDDETSALCQWQIPEAHFLEAWSDARARVNTKIERQERRLNDGTRFEIYKRYFDRGDPALFSFNADFAAMRSDPLHSRPGPFVTTDASSTAGVGAAPCTVRWRTRDVSCPTRARPISASKFYRRRYSGFIAASVATPTSSVQRMPTNISASAPRTIRST